MIKTLVHHILRILKSNVLFASVQLSVGSRPKTRSCLRLVALRSPLQALVSQNSPFTTAGLCPGVDPGLPVA